MVDVSEITCLMAIENEKNVAPLVEYLRSGKPLDQQFRNQLADLLDGNAPGNIKLVAERRKGRPSKDIVKDYEIGEWIAKGGGSVDEIEGAMKIFLIKKSKAYECLKTFNEVEASNK